MAKVRVLWSETTQHEAVIEIGDETYTGSPAQEEEIRQEITDGAGNEVDGPHVVIDSVETLRKGTAVPADIKAPAHEPEF
jgi:hypothetical protein